MLFSGIRHEIGNPVSSLLIIMSLLRKKYETSRKEAIREYLDQAIAQVERIEYLLMSLKNFNMYENLQIRSMPATSFLGKICAFDIDGSDQKRHSLADGACFGRLHYVRRSTGASAGPY